MHESVFAWVAERIASLNLLSVSPVLEVGSLVVNGSVRTLFGTTCEYTGVDIVSGPGVDRVVEPTTLPFAEQAFPLVVSTEMLEHAEFPVRVLGEIFRVLRSRGTLLLTTRSEGFPYHCPPDYHRFSVEQITELLCNVGFRRPDIAVELDPQEGHPGVFVVAAKA
jgi:SAM-dependent methyltransferase